MQTARELQDQKDAWEEERTRLLHKVERQRDKAHEDLTAQQEMFREKIRTLEVSVASLPPP